jgi:GrxC family glutaredoxin
MNRIEVYSADNCPWCERAKSLLRTRGLDFVEIDSSSDPARAREMTERSGQRTIPQVFIDDVPIGGSDELSMIDQPDKLDEDHITVTNRGIQP